MDMKLNPTNLESFFSPNHQPHSLSTIWADKNKEEDVDQIISDMDDQDQTKEDPENSKENDSAENLNDAFEWENGVGTLPGSDLKFRVNEHGDIEVITESIDIDEHLNKVEENNDSKILENGNVSSNPTPTMECDSEIPLSIVEELEKSSENEVKNAESKSFKTEIENNEPSTKKSDENEQDNFLPIIDANEDAINNNQESIDKDKDVENPPTLSQKEDEVDTTMRSESSLEDNLADFDPVLNEDIASMLYENANVNMNPEKVDDFVSPVQSPANTDKDEDYSPDHSDLKITSIRSDASPISTEPGKCIICGNDTSAGKRFCSRQCVGRNAALRRRENQIFYPQRYKRKRRHSTRGGIHHYHHSSRRDQRSPNNDDVLTVVQDQSPGKKNDLKIKIRWSSASNENLDDPDFKDLPKRKSVLNGGYDSLRGSNREPFSWSSYLEKENAVVAPPNAFKEILGKDPYLTTNPFLVGMAVEGVDPEHESLICPLFVAEIRGCRIRLSFCGYSECHDFWRNCDSPLIFPCGFCKRTNRILQPPKGCHIENFVWEEYAKSHRIYPAPKSCFSETSNIVLKSEDALFQVGQKLEAVDKHNPDLTCVATLQDIVNGQLLIHFDGWSHNFDFWCPTSSHYIHPAGWCQQNGKVLSLPEGYDTALIFNWNDYLTQTQSTAVDESAFSTKFTNKFEQGMRIEAVDPRNKRLIRVATVAEISDFRVKIHFDGWSDMYDFDTNIESVDLHPSGWCDKSNHPLEPPVSLGDKEDLSWQTGACPIPGCTGLGHIKGAKFMTHYSEFGCPYSPQNLTKEVVKDRLTAYKPRRSANLIREEDNFKNFEDPDYIDEPETPRSAKVLTRKRFSTNNQYDLPSNGKRFRDDTLNNNNKPERHGGHTAEVVSKWSIPDVARFIRELTSDQIYEQIFTREEIDGEAMLMLTQSDMLRILKIKLGPAVKIYNAILSIKEAV